MFVHADHAGDYGMIRQVHAARAFGNRRAGRAADGGDLAMIDDDGLILGGRRAGPIDHPDVNQRDHGRIDTDKGLGAGKHPVRRLLSVRGGKGQQE